MIDLVSTAISLGLSPSEAEEASLEVIKSSDGMAEPTIMRQQVNLAFKRVTNTFTESEQMNTNNDKVMSKK